LIKETDHALDAPAATAFRSSSATVRLKTDERGIVKIEDTRAAWFKDPDGNILAVDQRR
jgi:hypothetical protein